jgi:NAD(P)-dependent dehydrogenase (short-subunit alcohol dehydrogenase family)
MDLTGQTAVIVGGTGDIGSATARLFIDSGASVVITGRSPESVSRRGAELGAKARAEVVEPHDDGALETFFRGIGEFDYLAVTLGTQAITTAFRELPEEQIMLAIEDKLLTYTRALRAALPYVAQSVTWLTAAAARTSLAGLSGYAAPNGALHAMLGPIAMEIAPIRINCVSPGLTRTAFWDRLGMDTDEQKTMFADAAQTIPLRRIGAPEDVGQAMLFAATNRYVTGEILDISGGLQLGTLPSSDDTVSYGNQ